MGNSNRGVNRTPESGACEYGYYEWVIRNAASVAGYSILVGMFIPTMLAPNLGSIFIAQIAGDWKADQMCNVVSAVSVVPIMVYLFLRASWKSIIPAVVEMESLGGQSEGLRLIIGVTISLLNLWLMMVVIDLSAEMYIDLKRWYVSEVMGYRWDALIKELHAPYILRKFW